VGCLVLSLLGAGWANTAQAVHVLRLTSDGGATSISLEHLTGIPSAAIFVMGLAVLVLVRRHDRFAFVVAIATAALSTPVAYFGSLALLAVGLAPTVGQTHAAGRM